MLTEIALLLLSAAIGPEPANVSAAAALAGSDASATSLMAALLGEDPPPACLHCIRDNAAPTNSFSAIGTGEGAGSSTLLVTGGDDGTCQGPGCTHKDCQWIGQLRYNNATGVVVYVEFRNGGVSLTSGSQKVEPNTAKTWDFNKTASCSTQGDGSFTIDLYWNNAATPSANLILKCADCDGT